MDKQYILRCINPNYDKYRGRKEFSQIFSWFRVSKRDDYFHFGMKDKRRDDCAVLNGTMIENIEKKYMFCSVAREQNGKGLYIICKRDRWNECSHCGEKFWEEKKDESWDYQPMYDYKNKSLCFKCHQKAIKK